MLKLNQLLHKKKKILIFLKLIIVIGILLLIHGSFIKGNPDESFINQNNLETLLPPEQFSLLDNIDNEIKDKINNILKISNYDNFNQALIDFSEYIKNKKLFSIIKLYNKTENNMLENIIEYLQGNETNQTLIQIAFVRPFDKTTHKIVYKVCRNTIILEIKKTEQNEQTIKKITKVRHFNNDGFVSWTQDSNNPWDSWDAIEEERITSGTKTKTYFEKTFKNDGSSIDYSKSHKTETIEEIDDLNSKTIIYEKCFKSDGSIDWANPETNKLTKYKININNNYKEISEKRFFSNDNLISWQTSYNFLDIKENDKIIKKYCVFFDAAGKILWNVIVENDNERKNFAVPNQLILDLNSLSSNVTQRENQIKQELFKKNEDLFLTLGLSENDVFVFYDSLKDKYIVKFSLEESSQEHQFEINIDGVKLNKIFQPNETLIVSEKNVLAIKNVLVEKIKKFYTENNITLDMIKFEVNLIENNGNKTNEIILINSEDSDDLVKCQIIIKLEPLNTIIQSTDTFDIKTRNPSSLKSSIISKYLQLKPLKDNLKIEFISDSNKAFISYDDNIIRSNGFSIESDKNKPIIIQFSLISNPKSFLSSFVGFEEVKKEFKYMKDYLNNPKKYDEMKIKIPRGYILHGPPGTGKTHLARTLASDLGVPFESYVGSELIGEFIGESEKNVRKIFELARQKQSPCIIFIDEIDSLLSKRLQTNGGGDGTLAHNQTVNQFLSEMDGFKEDLYPIFVIGATNRLDSLDPAATRSGRLEKHIFIGLPKKEDAKALLKKELKDKNLDRELYDSDENIKDDFLEEIAEKGINLRFSNADFIRLINQSIYSVLDLNDETPKAINKDIILQNLDKIQKEKKIIKPYVSDKTTIIDQISLYFILLGLIIILIGCFFVIYKKYQKKKNIKKLNF